MVGGGGGGGGGRIDRCGNGLEEMMEVVELVKMMGDGSGRAERSDGALVETAGVKLVKMVEMMGLREVMEVGSDGADG